MVNLQFIFGTALFVNTVIFHVAHPEDGLVAAGVEADVVAPHCIVWTGVLVGRTATITLINGATTEACTCGVNHFFICDPGDILALDITALCTSLGLSIGLVRARLPVLDLCVFLLHFLMLMSKVERILKFIFSNFIYSVNPILL